MKEVYAVGMPRCASVYFHDVVRYIAERVGVKVLNDAVDGHQHLPYSSSLGLCRDRQIFGIYRDIRDVVVSVYFYVRDIPSHPLDPVVKGKRVKESVDILITHPNCLSRYVCWFLGYWGKPFVHLVSYEQATGPHASITFRQLFRYLGVDVPLDVVDRALRVNSLESRLRRDWVHDRKLADFRYYLTAGQIEEIEQLYSVFFELTGYRRIFGE